METVLTWVEILAYDAGPYIVVQTIAQVRI